MCVRAPFLKAICSVYGFAKFEGFTSNTFQEYFLKNIKLQICLLKGIFCLFALGKLILMDV